MTQSERYAKIFEILAQNNTRPQIELQYSSPYTLAVAVILSAQSTDIGVNKVTPELFKMADSPQKMLDLGIDGLIQHIKSIGLYNSKAKNIIAMSEKLIAEYDGEIPDGLEALQSLPGIGSKSARVIANEIFGHSFIAVDTHVFRVANRIGLCDTKNVKETERVLEASVPEIYMKKAHHWLVLHGRYVCKALKPACSTCILQKFCAFYSNMNNK